MLHALSHLTCVSPLVVLQDTDDDNIYNEVLNWLYTRLSDAGGQRGDIELALERSQPRSYSIFQRVSMKIGLGRIIRALSLIGASARTIDIGMRLAFSDATTVQRALAIEAPLVFDFSLEVPYSDQGIEVYTQPRSQSHPGLSLGSDGWRTTFDGENKLWVWHAGKGEDQQQRIRDCEEALASLSLASTSYEIVLGRWMNGIRPLRAEIELVARRHIVKVSQCCKPVGDALPPCPSRCRPLSTSACTSSTISFSRQSWQTR